MSTRKLFWVRWLSSLTIAGLLIVIVFNLADWKVAPSLSGSKSLVQSNSVELGPWNKFASPSGLDRIGLKPSVQSNPVELGSLNKLASSATLGRLRTNGVDLTKPLPSFNSCGAGSAVGDTYFTLAAVGDLLLHYNIINTADRQGYDYLFDKVRPFLQAANLTYANFEGSSNPNAPYSGVFPLFNYDPKLAKAAAKAGIDLVSTANNHALDTGPSGLDATLGSLATAGLAQHGTTARNAKRQVYQPFELKQNNIILKGSFLAYTWGTNGLADPYKQVNELWDANGRLRQSVKDDLARARQETELVVVAAHWGNEYQFLPTSQQIQGAKELTAAGADLILGDHPHTLQPVDLIESEGRQAMLIYSLGNFIAAQDAYQAQSFTQTSLILYLGVTKQADGKVALNGYRYLPVFIENNTRPVPLLLGSHPEAYRHILQQMRDPQGTRAVNPLNPPSSIVSICPEYTFAEASGLSIPGDFAQYFATLGTGDKSYQLSQSLALIGFPTSKVVEELSGDCSHLTRVLYTERARLELQPEANWPFRVVGTQLGTNVYFTKYKPPYASPELIPRRLNLAIANPRFKAFFQAFGGLNHFGYPISDELTEIDRETGKTKIVQYFERSRFEYVKDEPENPDPLYRVQLGLLTKEADPISKQCFNAMVKN
ncbi:MAG: CapA family protein [Chloroflexi bacterium]|nr:CapA family protein [Chloroflexota bacterium]